MLLLPPRMLDCQGAPAWDRHQALPTGLGQGRAHLPSSGPGPWVRRKQQPHACRCEPDPGVQDGTSYSGCHMGWGRSLAQRACPQHPGPAASQALCSMLRPSPER